MAASDRVLNLEDVELESFEHGESFGWSAGPIGSRIGARKLGYRLVVVPPGKKVWPYHCHLANEEMFLVLAGRGSLRYDDETRPLRAGDVVAAPPGRDSAHQILNTSDAELRFLAVSTMEEPDLAEYPDSGKLGVFAGSAPGGPQEQRTLQLFTPRDSGVEYFEGET